MNKKKNNSKFGRRLTSLLALFIMVAVVYNLGFTNLSGMYKSVLSLSTGSSYYVSSTNGDDKNIGSESGPWKTMDRAVQSLKAGDTLYIREGTYETIEDAWRFQESGTFDKPITVTNFPGEQAVFKINSTRMERRAFRCMYDPKSPSTRQKSPANYIKLIGTDISTPKVLQNGVSSKKGLVVLGILGANAVGIESIGKNCNNWEVAGFDFIETGGGIFQRSGPSSNWYVHDNRVYNYYRESGMQFNGDNNRIQNNEIFLVNSLSRTYGCQLINILGHGNVVSNNFMSRLGSTHRCLGILFEWDLADDNIIENNRIEDVPTGISFQGGDRNIIRNNIITASKNGSDYAIRVRSYDNVSAWPCNEAVSSFKDILPRNDPSDPGFKYYYGPRNCHSMYNQILGNKISGFTQLLDMSPVKDETNTFSTAQTVATLSPSPTTVTTYPSLRPSMTIIPTAGGSFLSKNELIVYLGGTVASGVGPTAELYIKDKFVTRWYNIRANAQERQFVQKRYTTSNKFGISDVKIKYINDKQTNYQDRNLVVDKVVLNGIVYQVESEKVYATGVKNVNGKCVSGNHRTEWLHCNGYISFSAL